MALVGNLYIAESDPGAVGYGYQWTKQSTGDLWARNTANTAWIAIGNINQANMGLAPKSGFAASGAITGVSGWAPVDSPDFSTGASLEGVSLATVNDITAVTENIYSTIQTLVAEAMSAYQTNTTAQSNVAIHSGTLNFDGAPDTAQTITLPTFASDGQMATQSQCKWVVTQEIGFIPTGLSGANDDWQYYFTENGGSVAVDPTTTLTFCAFVKRTDEATHFGIKVHYLIVAVR